MSKKLYMITFSSKMERGSEAYRNYHLQVIQSDIEFIQHCLKSDEFNYRMERTKKDIWRYLGGRFTMKEAEDIWIQHFPTLCPPYDHSRLNDVIYMLSVQVRQQAQLIEELRYAPGVEYLHAAERFKKNVDSMNVDSSPESLESESVEDSKVTKMRGGGTRT